MKYGKVLQLARKNAGLNQEELAHELHIMQSDVSRLENDKKEAPFSLVMKWAQLTSTQEVFAALVAGADLVAVLTQLLTM